MSVNASVRIELLGYECRCDCCRSNVNTVVDLDTNFEGEILPSVYKVTCTWDLCGLRLRHMNLPSALYFESHENKYRTCATTLQLILDGAKVQATIDSTHICRWGPSVSTTSTHDFTAVRDRQQERVDVRLSHYQRALGRLSGDVD